MKFETFFDNFDVLAEAPNGVKKLREMILQLAVRGKLVEQDEKDESASTLIKNIKAEKERLVKEKKINNARALPTVDETKIPYNLPKVWEWVRLGDLCHDWGQKKPDVEFTYIDVSAIDKEHGIISDDVQILKPNEAPSRARKIVSKGTVIYATVRPYLLNIAVVDKEIEPEPIVSTAFAVLHPLSGVLNKYLYYYLRSKPFIAFVESEMTGVAYPAINDGKLYLGLVPLPPSNEQHRIVTKVDQLMSLCDELEACQQKKHESHTYLNSAALDRLFAARALDEFTEGWRCISDNFDLLYDVPENVGEFRKAILQLAVMGKLVVQDEKDEPAGVLLKKILAEKERLIKEKKIKKIKPLQTIESEDVPYIAPKGWEWIRLDAICNQITDGTHHTPTYTSTGVPFLSVKDISSGKIDLTNTRYISKEEHEELIKRCKPEFNDVLFTKVGTTGIAKVIDVEVDFSIFVSLSLLKFSKQFCSPYYLELVLNSPFVKAQSKKNTMGVGNKNLVLKYIENLILPLPPLAEQRRIVARINQLMSFCDKLETGLLRSQADSEKLMEAVVGRMLADGDRVEEKIIPDAE